MAARARAALYHRVSTVDQNPHAARKELLAAARRMGLRVALDVRETGKGANNEILPADKFVGFFRVATGPEPRAPSPAPSERATIGAMAKSKQRATYDDLLTLPAHLVGEIIDGELIASPRPDPTHARAATILSADLVGPFDRSPGGPGGPGGWWILFEPELHVHGDVLVPDVAGWRREHMTALPKTPAIELPPDWVCEVLSPSTARYDRRNKMAIYSRERVAHVWLVDPLNRTLEVFQLDGERMGAPTVYGGNDKARVEPFASVEMDLSRWWTPPEGDPDNG